MAYPYSTLATNKADSTSTPTDHPGHHNSMASALNDLLTELGSGPKGSAADVTVRLSTLDTTVANKQPLDADLTTLSTAFATASASGPASLAFHEDTDFGTNKVTLRGPTTDVTADKTLTLPDATDTLVGKATTDALTNKSIDLASNTLTGTTAQFNTALSDNDFATLAGTETLTNKTVNLSSNTLTGTTAQFNTALSDNDFATLAGTETLTNKTVNLTSNTLTGTTAQFNTALSDNDFATLAGTETLTNKTVNLTSNTLTGTTAQFNTALSDNDFATLAGTETLTNKTLTTPTIGSFTNATHDHSNAAGGGTFAHANTTSRTADDHTQYALLAGRAGGNQTLYGSTDAGGSLILGSTSNVTKGLIYLGSALASAYDGVNERLGIGTTTPTFKVEITGATAQLYGAINTSSGGATSGAGLVGFMSTTPASGDRLGFLGAGAFVSATQRFGGVIQMHATQAWTLGSAHGTRMGFNVTANGASGVTERMRLDQDGTISMSTGLVVGAAVGTALTSSFVALEVNSTTKAFLLPRMSATQRDAMTATNGMMIYLASGTGSPAVQAYVGGAWVTL